MFKKLDWFILKSFVGPFIITFFIALFVLLMQTVWKYVDDLVGKGLDFATIGQFLIYMSATLLMLAMPIAILISSIMTFGNLGESFELVAIKSSGISLLRFMRPLLFVAVLLSIISFVFANYVVPYATLKSATLYNDIRVKKPALDLKEGSFYTTIPNYAIKISKKDADNKTIHNVVIFDQTNSLQDNCITAKKGLMQISDDGRYLEFNLQDGYRYQERGAYMNDTASEYIRLQFKTYKKLFDLSILQSQKTSDSIFKNDYKMLSVTQLDKSLDSIKKLADTAYKRGSTEIKVYFTYGNYPDSVAKKIDASKLKKISNVNAFYVDSLQHIIYEKAISNVSSLRIAAGNVQADRASREKAIRNHYIEWHRKFSLSMACIILFFIGAPLGSIIRKGGIGMPLVVAIVFFLLFHLLNTFGEKFAKEGEWGVIAGMWLSVFVLIPIGAFLTYKALNDSQLFNKELYIRFYGKIKSLLPFKKGRV